MSRRQPVETHGHLYPVDSTARDALRAVLADWALADDAVLEHEGDLLRFSVQGVIFPLDAVEAALSPWLTPASQGKIDVIDREAWTLTRLQIAGTTLTRGTRNLNDVLDHSGF